MEIINSIYIYGKSGHGSVVADIALANGYKNIIYIDDDKNKKNTIKYSKNLDKSIPFVIGIGSNKIRKKIAKKLLNDGFYLISLIHPTAYISTIAKIETGSVVMPFCIVNANASIGVGAILNSGCIIEHDCRLGDFVHVSPNASLSGDVCVGDLTHIGISSCIKQGIKIGKNCIVGAGSVVIRDIKNHTICAGVPAKMIRKLK